MDKHIRPGGVAIAALCLFAGSAFATDPAKTDRENQYKAAVAHADAQYTAAKDACKQRQGNDRDVCIKEAKAQHTAAVADAKAARTSTTAMASAHSDRMDADYKVAKEKCDSLSGDA
ncbi:MAG TPA: hypothetical protein VKE72_06215, partial [Methylocella sp.]|nr:hypothetical protein [Methylocella sp.]